MEYSFIHFPFIPALQRFNPKTSDTEKPENPVNMKLCVRKKQGRQANKKIS